jgi:hypothetical protein
VLSVIVGAPARLSGGLDFVADLAFASESFALLSQLTELTALTTMIHGFGLR